MKRRTAAAVFATLLLWSSPVLAWDPEREGVHLDPPGAVREPDTAPFIAPPPGVYYVTDTYVADPVVSSGLITTYSTTTVHESTGSYARVLDTVGTGASSAFDGSAFNGRRLLSDGRPVAGTYYENYVLTNGAFVPISIVFFQDDAELARLLATTAAPGLAAAEPAPSTTTRSLAQACCPGEGPAVTITSPAPPSTIPIRPGLSLFPSSAPLAMLEVLRGRAVSLYPRAFVEGRELPVLAWTVLSGDVGQPIAITGSGAAPFRTSWPRLAPPGSAYEVVFMIEVEIPDGGRQMLETAISVVVRSPALEH